jgi:energy-coupling factor transport system substrate-specific component
VELKRVIFMSMCVTILFVQEQMLVFIPNVQFTTLLIVLFSSIFKLKETIVIIIVYVLLDNIYMGTLYPLMLAPMLIAWLLIPISYHTILRRTKNEIKLALFGLIFGFVYGWIYIPFRMIEQEIFDFWAYLILDIPFEIIMAISNFVTIMWLFKPLYKTLSTEMIQLESENGYSSKNS